MSPETATQELEQPAAAAPEAGFPEEATFADWASKEPQHQAEPEQPPAEGDQAAQAPKQDDINLEELLKRPEVQQLIERRANNLLGNRLQQQKQEEEQFQRANEFYERLKNDDAAFEEFVETYGEAEAFRWIADFLKWKEQRSGTTRGAVDPVAFAEDFNTQAVSYFKAYAQSSPVWQYLPQRYQKELMAIQYNPEAPWIEQAFEIIGKGIAEWAQGQARPSPQEQKARRVIDAAMNQAQSGIIPPPNGNRAGVDPRRVIAEYGLGRGNWTLEDYDWARQQLGQEY